MHMLPKWGSSQLTDGLSHLVPSPIYGRSIRIKETRVGSPTTDMVSVQEGGSDNGSSSACVAVDVDDKLLEPRAGMPFLDHVGTDIVIGIDNPKVVLLVTQVELSILSF